MTTRSCLLLLPYLVPCLLVALPVQALDPCRDQAAKDASDQKALSFFGKQGEIFHPAKVLKLHSPTRVKEVASYVKFGEKRYSIFNVVTPDCRAIFRKRTRQGY